MNWPALRPKSRILALFAASLLIVGLAQLVFNPSVHSAQLGDKQLLLDNNTGGATGPYNLSFNLVTPGVVGSIVVEFCSNDPFPGFPCVPPAGFSAGSATLASQTGETGFIIDSGTSTDNRIVLARPATAAAAGPVNYVFNNVTNPTTPGSYFVRLQTFTSTNGTGSATDEGGLAFSIASQITITGTVPPYLAFCTGLTISTYNCASAVGDLLDLGELSSTQTRSGTSQMMAATNAQDGYNITLSGITMTSGINQIDALSSTDVSRPGVSQFGLNLMANSTPSVGEAVNGPGQANASPNYALVDRYRFVPGETLVQQTLPDEVRKFTVSYISNVPATQPPGLYVSTVTYICLANF